MEARQSFMAFVKAYTALSKEAEQELLRAFEAKKVKKGDVLLNTGKVCQTLYFLVKGTTRTYFLRDGKDITYWIYPHDTLFTSWNSFLNRMPAVESIEVLEDGEVLEISWSAWQEILHKHPDVDRFARLFVEQQFASLDEFYRGYYFLTAKEKYELLLQAFPDVVLRANLGYIASMLGISQETLSRVRGK